MRSIPTFLPPSIALPRPRRRILRGQDAAVLLVTVFLVAFSALLVTGLLHGLTTDLQISHNHIWSTKALYIADAGIEHAIRELRADSNWRGPYTEVFPAGSASQFSVSVTPSGSSLIIDSSGTSGGFTRTIKADLRLAVTSPPYPVKVFNWKEQP